MRYNMEIENYKWYKTSELLPEKTLLPKDCNGVEGWFLIVLPNGDLSSANRWIDGNYWYWDTDSDYSEKLLESEEAPYWMRVETPN